MNIYLVLAFLPFILSQQHTSCDFELVILKNSMGKYLSKSYNPPQADLLWSGLNDIRGSVDATWLLCFNTTSPIIINPKTPNEANCIANLNRTANMAVDYANKPDSSIRSDIDHIDDVIKQTVADCEDILHLKAPPSNTTFSSKCNNSIIDFNQNLLSNYTNERILGNDGRELLNNIAINLEYQRRNCDFRSIVQPNYDESYDNCQSSNDFFGYVAENIENFLDKQDLIHYVQYFKFYYQTAMKAAKLCKNQTIIS